MNASERDGPKAELGHDQVASHEPRHVSLPLMIGLVGMPLIFVWFLLRPGYSRSLRQAAFTYAFALPTLSLLGALAEFWAVLAN
jgi:hypothetical protein